jgi:hypothetical protein
MASLRAIYYMVTRYTVQVSYLIQKHASYAKISPDISVITSYKAGLLLQVQARSEVPQTMASLQTASAS